MSLPPSHPLAPYASPSERGASFAAHVQQGGGVVVEYGKSVEGRPLFVARFDGPSSDAPAVLLSANIHVADSPASLGETMLQAMQG